MAAGSEQRFVQQLKRGVLEMLVLQLLADRPGHGYELIVRLRESGGHIIELFDRMEKGLRNWDALGVLRVGPV